MIEYFDKLDSTNAYCLREANDLPSETLVVARSQTAGRGRRGRSWVSPPDQNFYGSLLLKPPFGDTKLEHLHEIAGLAVYDTVTEMGLDTAWIKWPNDVYVGHKKLAGILAECSVGRPGQEALVVGIGVNLNMEQDIIDQIDRPATSFYLETGKRLQLEPFAEELYANLLQWYRLAQDDAAALHEKWATSIPLIGKQVEIVTDAGPLYGEVIEICENGSIRLRLDDGREEAFFNGDVSLRV